MSIKKPKVGAQEREQEQRGTEKGKSREIVGNRQRGTLRDYRHGWLEVGGECVQVEVDVEGRWGR